MSSAELLTDMISDFEASLSSWKGKPNVLLPSASQLYRQGLLLANLVDDNDNDHQKQETLQLYKTFLAGLPDSHLRAVLGDLHEAFRQTLEAFDQQEEDATGTNDSTTLNIQKATQAMYGLYNTTTFHLLLTKAAGAGWSMNQIQLLDSVYHKLKHPSPTSTIDTATTPATTQTQLLHLLAVFLQEPTVDFEQLFPALNQLNERKKEHEPSTWEDLVQFQKQQNRFDEWKQHLVAKFTEPAQQGYLLSMFTLEEDEPQPPASNNINNATSSSTTTATKKPKAISPQDTVQRLVQQVLAVFPHLGEGYIETALSHFHGDVEQTTSALVEGQSHPATLPVVLQRLDPKLPARWKGPTSKQSEEADKEARRIAQESVRAMEEQAEAEARALEVVLTTAPRDEYDDDYDDQYDEIDGFMSNDHGLYDDYDAVRTYNKMMKQVEEEQAFWAENRNDNRAQRKNSNKKKGDSQEGENGKAFRGPDKLKGGRVPRPDQQQSAAAKKSDDDDDDEEDNQNDNTTSQGFMRGGGVGNAAGRGGGRAGGRGGGRGGRGGKAKQSGGGGGGGKNDNNGGNEKGGDNGNAAGGRGRGQKPGRGAARHKKNKLDSRRNKQKQAAAKQSGAG